MTQHPPSPFGRGTPARIFEHLQGNGTKVDVLVNNAGFGAVGDFAELAVERQLEMVQVNVTAVTYLTRLLLPGMIERHRGGILNVASTAGFAPGPGMAVYFASKAFLLSFSEAVAEELAGTGVTVTALCPGPTETNFAEAANARTSRLFAKAAMSAESVAWVGHDAFRQGRVVAIAGFRNRLLAFSVRLAPRFCCSQNCQAAECGEPSASVSQWLWAANTECYSGLGPNGPTVLNHFTPSHQNCEVCQKLAPHRAARTQIGPVRLTID
jgi:short-subunit dehydrogenase